ncbi:hypothetical protein EMIT0111MI5_180095 [Burkholderia sp. IT-111MI5]
MKQSDPNRLLREWRVLLRVSPAKAAFVKRYPNQIKGQR